VNIAYDYAPNSEYERREHCVSEEIENAKVDTGEASRERWSVMSFTVEYTVSDCVMGRVTSGQMGGHELRV
jgi:hypothetical protein